MNIWAHGGHRECADANWQLSEEQLVCLNRQISQHRKQCLEQQLQMVDDASHSQTKLLSAWDKLTGAHIAKDSFKLLCDSSGTPQLGTRPILLQS